MAKSPTEYVRDLMAQVGVLQDRDATRRAELDELKTRLRQELAERKLAEEKARDEITQLRRELAEARQETAVLKQQLQDHVAQYQEWDRRRWGLIVLLLGAVLSLASGLIVTLAKK
ncbi:unnamed protein product [Gemmata massiliana]|uniref:Uncharacterized protein n=1 Tax=Gemmata massiliana TaxID=1210884 RepID=A0A6P2D2F0_9BACT|nr:hypothetical protein [Gemmata massiliana]VTR94264.1 unnamed protein product [Gemmata massiliana]